MQVSSRYERLPAFSSAAALSHTRADCQSFVKDRVIKMITEGKYSIWFSTPIGEGAGIVEFGPSGELSGGDTTFSYIGNWEQDDDRFKAAISARRTAPGPPGVFGMDEIDIKAGRAVFLSGFAGGDSSRRPRAAA